LNETVFISFIAVTVTIVVVGGGGGGCGCGGVECTSTGE
jgi:hypothetical protein